MSREQEQIDLERLNAERIEYVDKKVDKLDGKIENLSHEYSKFPSIVQEAINRAIDNAPRGDRRLQVNGQDNRAIVTLTITIFVTVIMSLGSILQIQINNQRDHYDKIFEAQEKMAGLRHDANNIAHVHILDSMDSESDEILRIRAWKDEMERFTPELKTDIDWLKEMDNIFSEILEIRKSDRKNLETHMQKQIDDLKSPNEKTRGQTRVQ